MLSVLEKAIVTSDGSIYASSRKEDYDEMIKFVVRKLIWERNIGQFGITDRNFRCAVILRNRTG